MTIEQLYAVYLRHPKISTDTRKIEKGSIFFALKGDKFDANTFAEQALQAGAVYAVVDDGRYAQHEHCILVDDVLTTMQNLAAYHRQQLRIPVIGLTGTNGKTTTKELILAVLSAGYKTQATIGNLNNHIGVPLTLLSIKPDAEIAIIEMGANHQQEIAFLCSLAQPDYGLITNIGKAHLEGFGGVEGVKKGKAELYDYLKANDKMAIINHQNPILLDLAGNRGLEKVIYYGDETSKVNGKLLANAAFLQLMWWETDKPDAQYQLHTKLTGSYNFENILAAVTLGLQFQLSPEQINNALSNYQPSNNRSQIVQTSSNTVISDYYNANPSSMQAALQNIASLDAPNKVVILGDMFELGDEAEREHEQLILQVLKLPVHERLFIGKEFLKFKDLGGGHYFANAPEALIFLQHNPQKNATVLLKGSRGMALEQLMAYL